MGTTLFVYMLMAGCTDDVCKTTEALAFTTRAGCEHYMAERFPKSEWDVLVTDNDGTTHLVSCVERKPKPAQI